MAEEVKHGEHKAGEKKKSGFDKYKWYILGGLAVIAVVVFYMVNKNAAASNAANTAGTTGATDTGTGGIPTGTDGGGISITGITGPPGPPGPRGPTGPPGKPPKPPKPVHHHKPPPKKHHKPPPKKHKKPVWVLGGPPKYTAPVHPAARAAAHASNVKGFNNRILPTAIRR